VPVAPPVDACVLPPPLPLSSPRQPAAIRARARPQAIRTIAPRDRFKSGLLRSMTVSLVTEAGPEGFTASDVCYGDADDIFISCESTITP
jgi:hypothetical protein